MTRAASLILVLLVWTGLVSSSGAQTEPARADEQAARAAFEAGVEAVAREDWEAAASHFTESMARAPRVAAAYDLVIAYGHLARPDELARASDRFLELADPERHAAMIEEVTQLRRQAVEELGVLELTIDPADATVTVDGRSISALGEVRTLYLSPSSHRIRIEALGRQSRDLELAPQRGAHIALRVELERAAVAVRAPLPVNPYVAAIGDAPSASRDGAAEESAARGPSNLAREARDPDVRRAPHLLRGADADDDARRVTSATLWAAGAATWVSALILGLVTFVDADDLISTEPTTAGFLSSADRYREQRVAAIGTALAGSVLASLATLMFPWTTEAPGAQWWVALVGAALAIAGGALLIRSPDRLGNTRLTDPVRMLGGLLVSAGTPLLVAPIGAWIDGALEGPPHAMAGVGISGDF